MLACPNKVPLVLWMINLGKYIDQAYFDSGVTRPLLTACHVCEYCISYNMDASNVVFFGMFIILFTVNHRMFCLMLPQPVLERCGVDVAPLIM